MIQASAEKDVTNGSSSAPAVKIAYLCTLYPAVSHTFVLREVEALRSLGAQVDTFSIRRAGADQLLADADRVAFASTSAILPPRWTSLLVTHIKLALGAPAAYVSSLTAALRMAPAEPRGILWQLFYFVEAVMLWKECRHRGLRHIHVHLANAAADVALLAARIGTAIESDRPWSWSFTMHGPTEFSDISHYRLAEKVRQARFVVCISDYASSQLMTLSHPDRWNRLHVVHVGVPIEQFTNSKAEGLQQDHELRNPVILFIGRQVPEKGQAVLLEAVALLAEREREVDVVLAGDGPWRAEFERLAKRLGLISRVSFPGAVGQDEIRDLYASASIFCLPSFAEGVPVVLMEAMAMELPVVSTRITGIPELIDDGHTGLLVAPGRADELADALERLLVDPALRREIGSHARKKVICEFNTEKSAKQLYELFVRALSPPTDRSIVDEVL